MGIQISYNYAKAIVNTTSTSIDSLTSASSSQSSTVSTSHDFSANQLTIISVTALVLAVLVFLVLISVIIYKCTRNTRSNQRINVVPVTQSQLASDTVLNMDTITSTTNVQPSLVGLAVGPISTVRPPAPLEPYSKKQKYE